MTRLASWVSGTDYVADNLVRHEAVTYKCVQNHTASAANEPDAVVDATWTAFWAPQSITWGDWLYSRVPAWVRVLDGNKGEPLRRFLRIAGRSMNQTQEEVERFSDLKDGDFVPVQYLDLLSETLGLILPHAVDEASQRRLINTVALLYKRKGTKNALEFIATRYLGITISITTEDWDRHLYVVEYDDSGIDPAERPIIAAELKRILKLYEPAGLVSILKPSTSPALVGEVAGGDGGDYTEGEGDLNLSFNLNVTE